MRAALQRNAALIVAVAAVPETIAIGQRVAGPAERLAARAEARAATGTTDGLSWQCGCAGPRALVLVRQACEVRADSADLVRRVLPVALQAARVAGRGVDDSAGRRLKGPVLARSRASFES